MYVISHVTEWINLHKPIWNIRCQCLMGCRGQNNKKEHVPWKTIVNWSAMSSQITLHSNWLGKPRRVWLLSSDAQIIQNQGMSKDQIEDLHEIGAIDNAKFEVPGVGTPGCSWSSVDHELMIVPECPLDQSLYSKLLAALDLPQWGRTIYDDQGGSPIGPKEAQSCGGWERENDRRTALRFLRKDDFSMIILEIILSKHLGKHCKHNRLFADVDFGCVCLAASSLVAGQRQPRTAICLPGQYLGSHQLSVRKTQKSNRCSERCTSWVFASGMGSIGMNRIRSDPRIAVGIDNAWMLRMHSADLCSRIVTNSDKILTPKFEVPDLRSNHMVKFIIMVNNCQYVYICIYIVYI